jgi:hypothetical protein
MVTSSSISKRVKLPYFGSWVSVGSGGGVCSVFMVVSCGAAIVFVLALVGEC